MAHRVTATEAHAAGSGTVTTDTSWS